MTTYYGLYGQKVQYLASDPTDVQIGQVWYNSTSAVLKVRQEVATNAWASGGTLNTGRQSLGSAGTQTAAIAVSGNLRPFNTAAVELYDGTSWTSTTGVNNQRMQLGTVGSQTATLAFGGFTYPSPYSSRNITEGFNGSTWTNLNTMANSRNSFAGFGTQTAAIGAGGYLVPGPGSFGPSISAVESWNGTSWTASTALPGIRTANAGVGTQTAGLSLGGQDTFPLGPGTTTNLSWNGSSWTSVNSLNTARANGYNTNQCAGVQTSALIFGNDSPQTGATESWNGTSWTTTNPMSVSRAGGAGTGASNASALGFAGYNKVTSTEEWTGTVISNKTVTVT